MTETKTTFHRFPFRTDWTTPSRSDYIHFLDRFHTCPKQFSNSAVEFPETSREVHCSDPYIKKKQKCQKQSKSFKR